MLFAETIILVIHKLLSLRIILCRKVSVQYLMECLRAVQRKYFPFHQREQNVACEMLRLPFLLAAKSSDGTLIRKSFNRKIIATVWKYFKQIFTKNSLNNH